MSCGAVDAVRASPAFRPEPESTAIGATAHGRQRTQLSLPLGETVIWRRAWARGMGSCAARRGHDRGINIHRDQRPSPARRPIASQRPGSLTSGSARPADRFRRPRRVRRQRADQPRDHRVGRHRPGQLRLGAQHRDIGQAVPAQRQRHHQVSNDLPGSCTARAPPPGQPAGQALAQARNPGGSAHQADTGRA